jgi:hypothetical protein
MIDPKFEEFIDLIERNSIFGFIFETKEDIWISRYMNASYKTIFAISIFDHNKRNWIGLEKFSGEKYDYSSADVQRIMIHKDKIIEALLSHLYITKADVILKEINIETYLKKEEK